MTPKPSDIERALAVDIGYELGLDDQQQPLLMHWLALLDAALDAGAVPDEPWVLLVSGFWADHLGLDDERRGVLTSRLAQYVLGEPEGFDNDVDDSGEPVDAVSERLLRDIAALRNEPGGDERLERAIALIFDACLDVLADCADADRTVAGETALEVAAQELMDLRDRLSGRTAEA